MAFLRVTVFILILYHVNAQPEDLLVTDKKINVEELRCLVCQKSIEALDKEISKIDPRKTVDVGGHRLDADGNYRHKSVPQAKSEMHLSETIDTVCKQMNDYVRALWKSNGTLTLFKMVLANGKMNPYFDDVNIIQDDDLNKSLEYYCEGIMELHEESIIKLYQDDVVDRKTQFCFKDSHICPAGNKGINEEL